MTAKASIDVRGLTVRRGGRTVLDGIDLTVRAGATVGVIGPNGAGKTTLFDVLSARLGGYTGEVRVAGRVARDEVMATRRAVSVASVPEGAALSLTGWRYLAFVAAVEGYGAPTPAQIELAGELGMTQTLGRPMRAYSHGMRKKVSILASLNPSARLHIHDESFNGLDILALRALRDFFGRWTSDGRTLLVCSHTLPLLYDWCDEIVLIGGGRVVRHWGAPDLGPSGIGHATLEDEVIGHYAPVRHIDR